METVDEGSEAWPHPNFEVIDNPNQEIAKSGILQILKNRLIFSSESTNFSLLLTVLQK